MLKAAPRLATVAPVKIPALPGGGELRISQGLLFCNSKDLGGRVWPCAAALCAWLRDHLQVANSAVLELGCGTGTVGIYAAALGARPVVLSDGGSAQLLDIARHNVHTNRKDGIIPIHTEVDVCSLAWGDTSLPSIAVLMRHRWDLVLGSDLTYTRQAHRSLVQTLQRLLSTSTHLNDPRVILAHEHRRLLVNGPDSAVDECLKHFEAVAEEYNLLVRTVKKSRLGGETGHDVSLLSVARRASSL